MEIENWLPVVGFEGVYEVSDLGRVRSLSRRDSRGFKWLGKIVKSHPQGKYRHRSLMLHRDGKGHKRWVHRLVLESFEGPANGREARHFPDRDTSNNRRDNLQWGTRKENMADTEVHGTKVTGSEHHSARYNDTDLERVRDLRRLKVSMPVIARYFGMSTATVHKIEHGVRRG